MTSSTPHTPYHLGPRFLKALSFATRLHAGHFRKGTAIPYVSHLLAVTSLVLEHGGSETEACAAMLHDAIEDRSTTAGGATKLRAAIRRVFGPQVLGIVEDCTDTDIEPKPPWKARKQAYLAHLDTASRSALLVSCADKLHNARCILSDFKNHGNAVWKRFSTGKKAQIWYYRSLARCYTRRIPGPMATELMHTVGRISRTARRLEA
jgi:(p)ppGpp synthase/HD superfamily hydrolase